MNVRMPGKIELKIINNIPNVIIYNIFLSFIFLYYTKKGKLCVKNQSVLV